MIMASAGSLIPAAIYRRTSTERVTPETRLADCEDYARIHELTVVAVYADLEKYRARVRLVKPSGTRADRPGFQQMLADARTHKFRR
jgi:DNA invertase Pin-like site-specific DNA recombinase